MLCGSILWAGWINHCLVLQMPDDESVPQTICLSCEIQIENAELLRKRVQLTQSLWTRCQVDRNIPLSDAVNSVLVHDPQLLFNCHHCEFSSKYDDLQCHIAADHEADHVAGCIACKALLSRHSLDSMR